MFTRGLAEEPCSICLFCCLIYMYQAWLGDERKCRLSSKFCPVCWLCYITMHMAFHSPGPKIVSLQSHGLMVWKNPSWVAGSYFFMTWFANFAKFWPFLYKNCQKYGEGMFLLKNKCHIRTQHTQIPLWIPIVFDYLRKKIFTPDDHCPHIVVVMWPEALSWSSWRVDFIVMPVLPPGL